MQQSLFRLGLIDHSQSLLCSDTQSNDSWLSLGGLHHAAVRIAGDNVYMHLKHEGGTHRVQRIPEVGLSSRMQRIHTGTMSVIILPQPVEVHPKRLPRFSLSLMLTSNSLCSWTSTLTQRICGSTRSDHEALAARALTRRTAPCG